MASSGAISRFFGTQGRLGIRFARHVMDLFALFARLCFFLVRQPLSMIFRRPLAGRYLVHRIVVEQIYFTAVQALPIVIPIALLVGTMLLVQFSRIAGSYDLGKITVLILIREMGPLITAFIVLLRSGVAVTIEVSYMRILNEFEALEMSGIDPMHVVAYPRLVGITVAMLCLFVIFDLAAVFGGNAIAWLLTDIPVDQLLYQVGQAINMRDIDVSLLKALFFGVVITLVSLHRGLSVEKSVTAIPVACSRAAIESLFYLLIINVLISLVFYV